MLGTLCLSTKEPITTKHRFSGSICAGFGVPLLQDQRSAQATRPPLAALATDLIASSISRPSASKLSMMDIVDREADAERPRGG